jgi:hypothetical protein
MTRTLVKLALGASLAILAGPSDGFAGRGGGRGGGYGGDMQRGGGGGGGGGGGMQRGGGGGGGMSHSPSFSQPRSSSNGSRPEGNSGSGNRSQTGSQPQQGTRPPGGNTASASNRNANSTNPNAGAAAAGAGYANRNQSSSPSNAAPAAAGAGYANRNQSQYPNAAPAAAGAGYANRNQSQYPNAAPAAAGAGYANRNQSQYPNAGAAAAGAGYANRNQSQYPNAGAAAAGAAYANNNGYWNSNYGNGSLAAYGGMGMASPAYGYGSTPYMNPYAGMGVGAGGGGQAQPANVPANNAPAGNPSTYDYSQPVNPAAAPPDVPQPADPTTTPAAQAHQAFQAGDYANATQLTQQALAQTPNDVDLHQFLALDLFAQGNYEQAAAPLYAVLAVGPGWDWTTLIGNYSDASAYTGQLRGLEAFVKANPRSAKAQFVLAYHYISQGQGAAAIRPLKNVVSLQPDDRISAQLLDHLQPSSAAAVPAQPLDPGKMTGVWVAQAPPNATITLSISDETNFTWAFAAPGNPPVTISGTYTLANGVLTLAGKDAPGPLVGKVASPDDSHLNFKLVGSPANDPGLAFARRPGG